MANRRDYKTSKRNRNTYIYYDAHGKRVVELTSGENGVTQLDIDMLHADDDAEYNAQRREDYHIPVHYDAYCSENDLWHDDHNPYLADYRYDPELIVTQQENLNELRKLFSSVWNNLSDWQKELIKLKVSGRSNVSIAAEKGVSEAAIRKQLKTIQRRFSFLK